MLAALLPWLWDKLTWWEIIFLILVLGGIISAIDGRLRRLEEDKRANEQEFDPLRDGGTWEEMEEIKAKAERYRKEGLRLKANTSARSKAKAERNRKKYLGDDEDD